jgi:hypothetical protein
MFDSVVVMDTKFAADVSHIAEELQSLVGLGRSSHGVVVGGSSHDSPCHSNDLIRVQLQDLLYKRNMEELQLQATMRADATEVELDRERETLHGIRREVTQLRVLLAEAEKDAAAAKVSLECVI